MRLFKSFLILILLATSAALGNPAATADLPSVKLAVSTEDGKKQLLATVTRQGKPVEGATVVFLVERTFGKLELGHDQTLDDGTAATVFPQDLPGNAQGMLKLQAQVRAPTSCAGAMASLETVGGRRPDPIPPMPRALWAPRAPIELILIVLTLVGGVWGTYAYVIAQLVMLRKGASL